VRGRFDLVIFDCDGVIVDSEAITHRVFGEMLHELGPQMSAHEMYREFEGSSFDGCLAFAEQRLERAIP
jgi:beta-phosphoglucomutase-like phosphatase (HAD superfamily)